MAQYTALEWFYEEIIIKGKTNYYDLFEQAKAIEKKQIFNAYVLGDNGYGPDNGTQERMAEQYYNETYNK